MRRASRLAAAWLIVAMAAVGCGDAQEEPAAAVSDSLSAAATPAEGVQEAAVTERRFLPDAMRRDTRAEAFPHVVHVDIDCSVCHQQVPGHASHADLSCAECHRASAQATLKSLSRQDCLACHHAPERNLECASCHDSWGLVATEQTFALEVWETPRTRTIGFDHAWHPGVECASCHAQLPTLAPVPCSTCHEDHHAAEVRCASCHVQAPEGTHDLEVHRSCSGAGCHREPAVEALSSTRPVCLVCHQDKETHEPGGDCVSCHKMRADVSAHALGAAPPMVEPRKGLGGHR